MYQHQNFPAISQTRSYQYVADTTNLKEEEKDPSVDANTLDYAPDNKASELAPFDIVCNKFGESPTCFSPITFAEDSVTPLFDNKNQSNLITLMLLCSSTTKSQSSGDKLSITSSAFTHIMDNSSYGSNNHTTIVPTDMMESKGEDNEMAETEDLERLETCAMEESQEHTGGTKSDEDDQDGQDNKKQRFPESFSTLITGE
jgi:hypothetical protein